MIQTREKVNPHILNQRMFGIFPWKSTYWIIDWSFQQTSTKLETNIVLSHYTVRHTGFVLGSSSSELCFLPCIGPQTLFVWELMLTIFSSSVWSQGSLIPKLGYRSSSSLTEMSHCTAWTHGTMERLANPLISLYALSTEWGFSSCRHQEPILDSDGCQRGEERRGEGRKGDVGKWTEWVGMR